MKFESQLQIVTAAGVPPFTVNQTALVINLNADLLDGQHGSYYAAASSLGNYLPLTGGTLTGTLTGTVGIFTTLRATELTSLLGSNGPITITPDGTGHVHINSTDIRIGTNNTNATLATRGTGDLILRTHEGSANEGFIRIYDGANGNIEITPNGTGTVVVGRLSGSTASFSGALSITGLGTFANSAGNSYNENLRLPRGGSSYVSVALACDTSGSGSIAGQFNLIVYPTTVNQGAFAIRANGTDALTMTTGGAVNIPTLSGTTATFSGVVSGASFSGAGTGLTGTAASLNIGGNAATATSAALLGTNTGTNPSSLQYWQLTGNSTLNPNTSYWYALRMGHGDADTYYSATIAVDFFNDDIQFRRKTNGTNQSWRSLLHAGNFSSYALPLTGGTITGQLSINGSTASDILRLYITGSTVWKLGVTDASGSLFNITADFGNFTINKSNGNVATPGAFVSTVATGTAPLSVTSTTVVSNLNSDLLDGQHGSYFEGRDTTAIGFSGGSLTLTRTAGNLSVSLDGRYLPLTGGVLTGALTGTTAAFGGDVSLNAKVSFGNRAASYSLFHGGAQDLAWKKIADITFGTSLYSGATFKVEVIDANTNFGANADCKPMTFFVSCRRSGGVLNDLDSALVFGPVADYVRAVKTATGVYELQIRQIADWMVHTFIVEVISQGAGTVTYVTGTPPNGSTTGTIYLPTTGGYTQRFTNLAVTGATTFGGVAAFSAASGTYINTGGGNDAFGYNATAGLGHYIKGTGNTYIYGGGAFFDGSTTRTLLHAGNFNSYALPLTGGAMTGSSTISGDNHMTFGPNSTWSNSIRIGGNGYTATGTQMASVATTNGNLHLDSAKLTARGIYLNWYGGDAGTYFGNGSSGQVGRVDGSGNASFIGTVTSNYGTFSAPGLIVGDAQYGLYASAGSLFYKSASTGNHVWRNIANSANTMTLDNSGNLTITGTLTEGGYLAFPERVYTINLNAQSAANFYPIVINGSPGNDPWHHRFSLEMPSLGGASAYNMDHIHGEARGQGWSDQTGFYRIFHNCYENNERSVLGLWRGTQDWYGIVLYVRGGQTYYVRTTSRSVAGFTAATTQGNATFAIKNAAGADVSGTSTAIGELFNLINTPQGFHSSYNNYIGGTQVVTNTGTWGISISGTAATATTANGLNAANNYQVNSIGVGIAASGTAGSIGLNQAGTRSWSITPSGGNLNFASGDGSGAANFSVALQQGGQQVLHAGNYTSYAAGLGTYNVLTNVNQFRSNIGNGFYLGTANNPPLQAFSSDGGAAFMSFHRSGFYAVNMGLDPDNVLRIGGWSAAANRWQLDMSGNETIAGSLTAVGGIFSGPITQGPYSRRQIDFTSPAANFGNFKQFLRLWAASGSGSNLFTLRVSVRSTWNWATAYGGIEAVYSLYIPGDGSISSIRDFRITHVSGPATDTMRLGDAVIENGFVSIPVWCANTNPICATVEQWNGTAILGTTTAAVSEALPAFIAPSFRGGLTSNGPTTITDSNSGVLLSAANDARFYIRSGTAGAWLDIRSETNGYAAVNLYGGGATTGRWSAGMTGGNSNYRITSGAQGAGTVLLEINGSTNVSNFPNALQQGGNPVLSEAVVTFTPTAVGWYRIAIAGGISSGTIRITGVYDNRSAAMEFDYTVNGWNQNCSINVRNVNNYVGSLITQIRASNDVSTANGYLDIYIATATTPAPLTIYNFGPSRAGLVASPVVGAVVGTNVVRIATVINAMGFVTTGVLNGDTLGIAGNGTVGGTLSVTGAITQGGNQVLHAGNVSTYALPISGGTLTGAVSFLGTVYNNVGGARFFAGSGGFNYLYTNTSGMVWRNQADSATVATLTDAGAFNAAGAITQAGNQVVHAGNVSTYTIPYLSAVAEASLDTATGTGLRVINKTGYSSTLLTLNVAGSTGPFQLDANYTGVLRWRNQTDSTTWTAWKTLIHDANVSSYALPISGGTLTGNLALNTGVIFNRGSAPSITNIQCSIFNELNGIASSESLNFRAYGGFKWQYWDGSATWMQLTSAGLSITGTLNATGAITQGGNQVLHAGNYTGYFNNFVQGAGSRGRSSGRTNGSANNLTDPSGFYFGNTVTGMPSTDWWNWLNCIGNDWSSPDGYGYQLAYSFWSDDIRMRRLTSGTWNSWVSLIHSGNYTNYPPARWATGRTIALTGDVTGTSGLFDGTANLSFAATIANSSVTYAKIQNVAVSSVLGNSSASVAQAPQALSMATLAGMLSGQTMNIVGSSTSVSAAADQAIVNQHNGSGSAWYGRILSKNSTNDRSAFLGTYGSVAGVFAHNNALTAWADLYINTVDGSTGGTVRMPSSVLINGNQALHAGTTSAPSLSIGGNAATATNLSTNRTNWSTNGVISAVVGQLAWKHYNNNHTIFDASNSTSPAGGAISNTNAQVAWSSTYPTLMGWNGVNTYGVRVDSARVADSCSGSAAQLNGQAASYYENRDITAVGFASGTLTLTRAAGNLSVSLDGRYLTGNQTISLTGAVTGSGTTSIATTLANSTVTYAKIQNVGASSVLGNSSASVSQAPQEITFANLNNLLSGAAKAWVTFNENPTTGAITINASFNVSSITRINYGQYRVNFSTAFGDANYAISGTIGFESNGGYLYGGFLNVARSATPKTTTYCEVTASYGDGNTYNARYVHVVIDR